MVKAIAARNVKLHDLKTQFGLRQAEDLDFFREWQDDLPELTVEERQALDRVRRR